MKPRCLVTAVFTVVGAIFMAVEARAELARSAFSLAHPFANEPRARISLVPSLEMEIAPKRAFDAGLRLAMEMPRVALYCYGPSCAPRPFASVSFIKGLGGAPAAIAEYMCAGTKLGATTTYRFGLVAAIGGPAAGLRVRW